MAPPRNTRRRRALADAAITVLGTAGTHKLSHRAVDEAAGLPAGTAANYFPHRDELLAAAAERVAELQAAEMTAADEGAAAASAAGASTGVPAGASSGVCAGVPVGVSAGRDGLARRIAAALFDAATRNRTRYLAAFELALEATRQPALAAAMSQLGAAAFRTTVAEHRSLGLPTTPGQVQALIALYGGTLLTLVAAPPESVTREGVLALARSIVAGVLSVGPEETGV
jgi:AcrR family transcriptional regulator